MKIFLDCLILLFILYYTWKFISLVKHMKGSIILPVTKEEAAEIRKHPDKSVELPFLANHKVALWINVLLLIFVTFGWIVSLFKEFTWSFYFLIPLLLLNTHQLYQLFAITEEGILSGERLISWKKMLTYRVVPITINHSYFGYNKKVNDGYELIIKKKIGSIHCIVTSKTMLDRLTDMLTMHGISEEE